ncbi:preprotein translocase subunit SCY2, chloroplastic [Eucalyptus grandis]|uniref:preprotein translocase subunit SCY2, chloroplastic n=1 Tax=Eucalyptus grandis TaxID=71139 RepID=UPI00192E7D45|nr:preprotein translocase subunit SCY2, chloroplastic [Eucalyptus grandis]XP_010038100.2 preprotein translocase subunit SCY2, chloroplastic [Eucalyptus grandis]
MEATLLGPSFFHGGPFAAKRSSSRGLKMKGILSSCPPCVGTRLSLKTTYGHFSSGHLLLNAGQFPSRAKKMFSVYCSTSNENEYMNDQAASLQSLTLEAVPARSEAGEDSSNFPDLSSSRILQTKPKAFRNRFLNFVRLSSVLNNAAEYFFKSEMRRRLFVTAMLLVISRVGYFIPLPGFDRRAMPQDYLSFVSGSADELGDMTTELKLSFFQLGISPQIVASILMQVLCHVVPSLVKLRKEGLDGHEKIKSYIWWISLGFAILEGIIVSCYSLPYSIYATTSRVKHVMVTTLLLVCGAMTMTWICDTISESGFGQGSSLIICLGILTGYKDTLLKVFSKLSGSAMSWWPYVLAVLGIFTTVTMWAVVVTEGCRKIKLQYYGFKLASSARGDSRITEVEPYIPFNINPSGMQPVLTTSYLLAFPSILASILGSPFWERVKQILNPENSIGAEPWVYYSIYAFFVFLFNIFDIANLPKEIADYLNKMGARIPNIKPGKATIEYLTKIQASSRFWGGLLLCILATTSSILDHYLRRMNEGFTIGLTSVLIIVGSIIELRRSYQAYNVMPSLSKALRRYGV